VTRIPKHEAIGRNALGVDCEGSVSMKSSLGEGKRLLRAIGPNIITMPLAFMIIVGDKFPRPHGWEM